MTLQMGDRAPAHQAKMADGSILDLAELYDSQHVILYFYPKDFTPGCTQEAQDFRDCYPEIQKLGATVVGVSKDSLQSHEKFQVKYDLPFPLIADETTQMCQKFGVWQEKKMFKRVYMGIVRYTFLIQKGGIIHKSWAKVRVKNHVRDVVDALAALA